MFRIKHKIVWFVALLALPVVLTGCVKLQIGISINPDGSGTLGIAMGMTSQAKALAVSQGVGDPFAEFDKGLSEGGGPEITVNRWTEGDYEWAEGVVSFNSLDELNAKMQDLEMFESFQITKETGLLKDRFILEAEVVPSESMSGIESEFEFDPSTIFEARMAVTFPGTVLDSNGTSEGGKDSSTLSWSLSNDKAMTIYAASEQWNWIRVMVLAGGALVVLLAAAGLVVLGIISARRERAVA